MNILLHICCAPCACFSLDALYEEGHKVTGFWFNPNIHPWTEFRRRLGTLREFAHLRDLPVIEDESYPLENWLAAVSEDPENRCAHCYKTRLFATAKQAADGGFDAFTSTLFYSKHQNHELMKQIAEEASEKFKVSFLYRDFRTGWKRGIEISKKLGLYRQGYCGCIYSEKERYLEKIENPGKD